MKSLILPLKRVAIHTSRTFHSSVRRYYCQLFENIICGHSIVFVCVYVCVCVHAARIHGCARAWVCVGWVHFIFFNSNLIFYSDLIYYFTSSGREFLHYCDVAHKYSEEVILKRRRELLEVHIILPTFNLFTNFHKWVRAWHHKEHSLENIKIF